MPLIRTALTCILFLATGLFSSNASGQETYEFYTANDSQFADDTLIATVEFSQSPFSDGRFTASELVSLTFTQEGQNLFGFGEVYSGIFDQGVVFPDGNGGLDGGPNDDDGSFMVDFDVPESLLTTGYSDVRFDLAVDFPGLGDNFSLTGFNPDDEFDLLAEGVSGEFRSTAVPEPSSVSTVLLCLLATTSMRRKRC